MKTIVVGDVEIMIDATAYVKLENRAKKLAIDVGKLISGMLEIG